MSPDWPNFINLYVYLKSGLNPGGALIFSYIRRFGSFFWFKISNFNTFGGFQKKKEYFLGYESFVDISMLPHKICLVLGVISMHFGVFS